jgi:hypothetical protein
VFIDDVPNEVGGGNRRSLVHIANSLPFFELARQGSPGGIGSPISIQLKLFLQSLFSLS